MMLLRRRPDPLELSQSTLSTRLQLPKPTRLISIAGAHGGAGATSLALLLAHAVEGDGRPVLCIDIAGPSSGGLAALAGVNAAMSPMQAAALASLGQLRGRSPVAQMNSGVSIMGGLPDGSNYLESRAQSLISRLVESSSKTDNSNEVFGLISRRILAAEQLRFPEDEASTTELARSVLHEARSHHSLVIVDLGQAADHRLNEAVTDADLHIWICSSTPESLIRSRHSLAHHPHHPDRREILVVWDDPAGNPSPNELRATAGERIKTVIRLGNHRPHGRGQWSQACTLCLTGLAAICDQLQQPS